MNDHTFFHAAFGGGDAPLLRGGVNEHQARHRAHFAEALPFGGSGSAAAGHLDAEHGVVVGGIDGRGFDFDFGPVRFEFFVEEHRQAGVNALAHFGVVGDDGDGFVGGDANEGVGREDGARLAARFETGAPRVRGRRPQCRGRR